MIGNILKEVIDSGQKLKTGDNQIWLVDPVHIDRACIWLPSAELRVSKSTSKKNEPFIYNIRNLEEKETVRAMKSK